MARDRQTQHIVERVTTVPHETYITPTSSKILEVAREQGVKGSFGADLTKDLANMFSHYDASKSPYGYYTGQSTFNPEDAMIDFNDLKGTPEEKIQQQKMQDFLKKIPYSQYEGATPAHKAMKCLSHLSSMLTWEKGQGKDDNGENVEWLSELIQQRKPFEIVEELKAQKDMIDNLSEFQKECIGDEDLENFKISRETLMQLSILAKLKETKAIQTKGKRIKTKDTRGKHRLNMRMTEISDVSRVKRVNMLMPNFNIKLASKEFYISEKIRREDKKHILFYLEDDSGSMSEPFKIAFCNAMLMNRCEAVVNGEAELIFYSYERDMYNRQHIVNREQALNFYRRHKSRNRNQGSTDIGGCIVKAIEEIQSMDGVNPEIMIVCDGQDHVTPINTKNVKVHSFIIGQENEGLKNLCIRSGGIYVYEPIKN